MGRSERVSKVSVGGAGGGARGVRRYVGALMAVGLVAGGMPRGAVRFALAEEGVQAIDPVNIGGSKAAAPVAAEPEVVKPTAVVTTSQPAVVDAPKVSEPAAAAPAAAAPAAAVVAPTVPAAPATPAVETAAPAAPVAPVAAVPAVPAASEPAAQAVVPVEAAPAAAAAPAVAPAVVAPAAGVQEGATTAPATANVPATESAPATEPAVAATLPAASQPGVSSTAEANARDGKAYPVTGIKVNYYEDHAGEPAVAELYKTPIKLGVTRTGYVAPRAGVPTETLTLGEIGKKGPQTIYRSAIESVYLQIVRFYNARGIIGVFVVVDSKDIDANDNDIRPTERSTLQFIVVTSVVKHVRTLATSDLVPEGERVNNPRHARIMRQSPLQAEGGRQDLLNKDALDEYVLRLNRQPGRRVDVAVSGTGELGGVNLDYLVSENRPWYVYAQVSNTGTAQTDPWRERFGFVDNQLTGHDDVLSLDYMTAGFDVSHAVIGSYELPFFDFDRMRYRVYGSWNEFTASDVGQSKEHFTGSEYTVGNELNTNIFQHRELFVDLVGGARVQGVETTNQTSNTKGQATYVSPYVSLRLDRSTDLATTTGSLTLVGYYTQADVKEDVTPLGRNNPSQNPIVLQYEAAQTLFIEPLLDPNGFAAGKSTLANELYFAARGQYTFNYRLFPQAQDVAGGLYSVRGYPESIVAGDSVAIGTAEYRLHVPRLFAVQPDPTKTPFLWDKSFRRSPQQAYGHPDLDLIGRTFVDAARVVNTDHLSFEHNTTMVGTGVGVELQYRQNFNVRVDWGVALTDIRDEVKAGSNRFHIAATILY